MLPWLLGFFLFTVGPIITSFYLSFTNYDLFTAAEYVGLDNYVRMFAGDLHYRNAVQVTLVYVLLAVPLGLMVALGVALALNRGLKGISIYRTAFYIPSLLGGSIAVAVVWRQVFDRTGMFNMLLAQLGIVDMPSWIGHPDYALFTIILLHLWQFGAAMVIFLAGLRHIPNEYYEAAAIDGAGAMRSFFSVTLPVLSPIIFFNLVMGMIGAFQTFAPAYVITKGGPGDSTLLYGLEVYRQGFQHFRMGYASAEAWVLVAMVAAATAVAFWSARYWVHYDE
jgi:multiple sugar transport system permease protein